MVLLISFLYRIIDLPNQWTLVLGRDSLLWLPANPLSPTRTLEGLFELTRFPSRALDSPGMLLQRNKDTSRCAALGAEVPGHRQEQLMQTFIVRLLRTHFFTAQSLIVKSWQNQNRINLVTGPAGNFEWTMTQSGLVGWLDCFRLAGLLLGQLPAGDLVGLWPNRWAEL